MTARHKLGSGTPSVRSFELTPASIGDQFLLNALVELELIEDFEALYVVQDQDGNSARGFDFSGRAVSRQFRFQPTEQAMEEFVDMPAIEAALTSEMSSVDKRELFQLCLLLGAWGLLAYGAELIRHMGLKVDLKWNANDERPMDLLDHHSPAQARYFLWMAQRQVALDLLSSKLAPEDVKEALFDTAIALSKKYLSDNKKPKAWIWYSRTSESHMEVLVKRLTKSRSDLDLLAPTEVAFGKALG